MAEVADLANDDEVDPRDRADLEAHHGTCAPCRARAASRAGVAAAMKARLRALEARDEAPASLRLRVGSALEHERARTAGAVNVAYASLAVEPAPAPKREEPAAPACPCGGKGYTVRPDGSRWACQCKTCPDGKCPRR